MILDEKDAEISMIQKSFGHQNANCKTWIRRLLILTLIIVLGFWNIASRICGLSRLLDGSNPIETAFLKSLETNLAGNWLEKYTAVPHLAGQGQELVNWTAQKFEEYGLKTEIEAFDIYLNYPLDNSLKLLSKQKNGTKLEFQASLKEDVLAEDPTTDGDDLVPAFHGYSASGNVTGEYVYVNYGTKDDFKLLSEVGVSVEGKIAIARYGGIFRGLKVKFAQEAGAIGVILYSDPGDDYFQEAKGDKAYPEGPARNPSSLQRGSVQFLSQSPGDPTTPGKASQGNVTREDPSSRIPKIPSLPVSFKDVKPILEKLNGYGLDCSKFGGEKWIGNLPGFNYWTGPNPDFSINLYNNQSYDIRPIYNVYGNLTGTDPEEGYIIIGNHRDAWIKGGASDPNSGSASMLEIIRAFHELSVQGWKPRRTIIFASWDGEEYALLGSTEFGEKYSKTLSAQCLAYLNVDVSVSGKNLEIQASPFLNHVLAEALTQVEYPLGGTLYDHYFEKKKKFGILGSGSDYTVFLEHLGIASVDVGFTNGRTDPVYHYHSNYDSYHWMSTMADPGFKFHNALAQYLGLVALKLTEPKVIPTKISDYATELGFYFNSLAEKVPEGWLKAPVGKGSLLDAIIKTKERLIKFDRNAVSFDEYTSTLQLEWDNRDLLPIWKRLRLAFQIKGVNYKLRFFERNFVFEEGLKDRPWFKHIVYAAGRDTGYEGFALPGLKEALDDDDLASFIEWVERIRGLARHLEHSFS
ncbi:LAMI_0H17062g1_1 [Lachancea mirantina]|uniref:LAMI_0H17062g1_1 n=1 Tax=Lachancea mirantina TaxID=1230905 RepID=A0A1G4KJC2_9SACH|nr:LAMI_0H17062g1_1 [Lachancea mirantina]